MKFPSELISSLKDGTCAVYVGAGISRAAGMPSWKQLLENLIKLAADLPTYNSQQISECKRLLKDKSKYQALASILKRDLGPKFDTYIASTFNADNIPPSQIHKLIVNLPARLFITTNYDNLLERAYNVEHKGAKVLDAFTYKQVGQLASCLLRKRLYKEICG